MMEARGTITPATVSSPVINMCYFPMLTGSIRGPLYENTSMIVGSDIFCNIMWLHFGKNSVIRERLPRMVDNIQQFYLKDSGIDEMVCFHDECYGAYSQLAPAFGIEVPFKVVHLFEYLSHKLDELKDQITPIGAKVVYQRPCSNRLIPETRHWVDDIFQNALCCGGGGGNVFTDIIGSGADTSARARVREAVRTGAQVLGVACPQCAVMFEDALKVENLEGQLEVKEISEIVNERIA